MDLGLATVTMAKATIAAASGAGEDRPGDSKEM
jgi:hypothetical protein